MYKNRISRTSPNCHPQFFIPRSEIAFDERLAFVEHILAKLNESRFGPGSDYQSVMRSNGRPEPGAAVFYDLCDMPEPGAAPLYDFDDNRPGGLVPFYTSPSLGRTKYFLTQRTQSTQRINSSVFFVPSVVKNSLGRGSP